MALAPPTATWSLNETAGGLITVTRKLLEVVSGDNIQALAILSADAFGSVLPLCSETRMHIEQLARRGHTSHTLNFFKAQIGYKREDSVWQLSQTDGGVRFLCFVATLYTMDVKESATRLDSLLRATREKKTPSPTMIQLQDLLTVLESKLALSDFASMVAKWEVLFKDSVTKVADRGVPNKLHRPSKIPSRQAFQKLVLSMSQSCRVGEDSDLVVRLHAQFLPWCCAFLEWCIGGKPTIRSSSGRLIRKSENSTILVEVSDESLPLSNKTKRRAVHPGTDQTEQFQVNLPARLDSVRNLVEIENMPREQLETWSGMLTVEDWFSSRLSAFYGQYPQFGHSQAMRDVAGQVLFYIVSEVPSHLLVQELPGDLKRIRRVQGKLLKAFPEPSKRLSVAKALLKDNLHIVPGDANNLLDVANEGFRRFFEPSLPQSDHSVKVSNENAKAFIEELGLIGACLLLVSLFCDDSIESAVGNINNMPKLNIHGHWAQSHRALQSSSGYTTGSSFVETIALGWRGLLGAPHDVLTCGPQDIFKDVARLLGHKNVDDYTMISSSRGQVVFPILFDAADFPPSNYLQICVLQGILRYDSMKCDTVVDVAARDSDNDSASISSQSSESDEANVGSDSDRSSESDNGTSDIEMAELAPEENPEAGRPSTASSRAQRTSLSNRSLSRVQAATERSELGTGFRPGFTANSDPVPWKVEVHRSTLYARVDVAGSQNTEERVRAWQLIDSLSRAVLTEACNHRYSTTAGSLGNTFLLCDDVSETIEPEGAKHLIHTQRNYQKQLLALAAQDSDWPVMVHREGCIRCALEYCTNLEFKVLIS